MMRFRSIPGARCILPWPRWQGLVGCGEGPRPGPAGKPFAGTKVVVGVVLTTRPSSLRSRPSAGEWSARTGAELMILDQPVGIGAVAESGADVLIFPGDRLGDLVDARDGLAASCPTRSSCPPRRPPSRARRPLPPRPADDLKPPPTPYQDIVLAYRDQVGRYGPDRMALPIGGSALVVAFRRSAFDSPSNREAAKALGLTLEPPRTWEQFDALARFFQGRDWDGDGSPESGVALAWGDDPEGVGNSTLLARAAALGLHPDQFSFLLDSETTAPRVTAPPFAEALRAFADLKASGPAGAEKFDADAARRAFRSGEVALLIDRAERADAWGYRPGPRSGPPPCPARPGSTTSSASRGTTASCRTGRATCPTAAAGWSA